MNAGPVEIRSFLAWVWLMEDRQSGPRSDTTGAAFTTRNLGRLHVAYVPRVPVNDDCDSERGVPDLVLGDGGELTSGDFLRNVAGGVPIRYDAAAQSLHVCTSIVGMPAVYLYRGRGVAALVSDIHLLLTIPGIELQLDPASLVELGHVGHPVEHRTLFRDLVLVESGARLTLDSAGHASVERSWDLPQSEPLDWPQFLEVQMSAFTSAIAATDLSDSFLSLTAGLDTRTVFSTLAVQGRLLPSVTMSGVRLSLDAMIARRLCRAYGVEHFLVTFADDFAARMPTLLESASLLSGGLSAVGQAPEVYLYDQLGTRFRSRLSGNLGNQVGRGGTEGVSLRGARVGILGPQFKPAGEDGGHGQEHWLLSHLNDSQRSRLQFILKNETVFTSVGNYSIGSHYAAQQSPYANRDLIETLAFRPVDDGSSPSGSKFRMRLRDLKHRFVGEPEERSFQRRLVRRSGGFAAECPVNWGWRPSGGISPMGSALGAATLFGMVARAKGLDAGALRRPLAFARLADLHDFRDSRRWLRDALRDFTNDTLSSQSIRESDLFDWNVLQPVLEDHFTGRRDHYSTVVFALDVALAQRLFCERPG